MLRLFTTTCLLIWSCYSNATPSTHLYQIDLIVFTHINQSSSLTEDPFAPLLVPGMEQAIPLQYTESDKKSPYRILPKSQSALRNELFLLNHKPQYHVLFHYTWLQPANNQKSVSLSEPNSSSWHVEGTLRIRKSNYYLFDTELLFKAPNHQDIAFVFKENMRLKPGIVYYLDHPQAGMLIKVTT